MAEPKSYPEWAYDNLPTFHDPWAANCRVLGGIEEPDPNRFCHVCAGTHPAATSSEVPK